MFGWINDCTECLVVSQFGLETWHQIKEKAGNPVEDGGFLRYKYYDDTDTVALVVAASDVLNITVEQVLFAFGEYFVYYVQENGYSNVLRCLGSNLRDWLSNLNALHDHLQASYPEGFIAPVFWSEDDYTSANDDDNGAILVHYYSQRGSLLVPLVHGLITKIASVYFDIDINMELLQLQDDDNNNENDNNDKHKHTSWRITTIDPSQTGKLRGECEHRPPVSVIDVEYNDQDQQQQQQGESKTAIDSNDNNYYEDVYKEGEKRASDLRTEEFVKRNFMYHNNKQQEHHYFSGNTPHDKINSEHMIDYTVKYFQQNLINGRHCYDVWTMEENDPETWATLDDLLLHFPGCPVMQKQQQQRQQQTTSSSSSCQSQQPTSSTTYYTSISVSNASTGLSTEIFLNSSDDDNNIEPLLERTMEEAILSSSKSNANNSNNNNIMEYWPEEEMQDVRANRAVIECCLMYSNNINNNDEYELECYHAFTLPELRTTTIRDLLRIAPSPPPPKIPNESHNDGDGCCSSIKSRSSSSSILRLVFQCVQVKPLDDDEEDI